MKEQTIIKNRDKLLTKSPSGEGKMIYDKGLPKKIKDKYKKSNLNEGK